MRWPLALMCGMALVALSSGCHGGKCDLVEAELRARDCDLRELRDEMDRLVGYNKALQQEVHSLRGEPGPPPPGLPGVHPPTLEPPLLSSFPIRSLTLGRLTGGYESGSCTGDSALQVVLEPRDCDQHVIKVPASARIVALEIAPEGTKKPLSEWDVSPDQLRTSWRSGLFGSGYTLILHWKVYPTTNRLRVKAQLQTADGRVFEADKDVTVRVVPPAFRKMPGGPDSKGLSEDPFFPSPPSGPVLPEPRPIEKGLRSTPEPENLKTPPTPVDPGPTLPPPMPPPGSSGSSGWHRPSEQPGWGPTQPQSWGVASPLKPPVQIQPPRPLPSEW